ncbi:hypothetical protein C7999DRAFT_14466 [Corynascus novoguineensis]|uniref:Uncharacterized protein n=1 Tax=Corynascus novoguineensis TaxID=1126955 RepID=A0AAN7HFB8_9PEZI|nr:hypothetical protein C7999DRAFT_14466 [Corynascus novoguineensis]
MRCTTTTTLLGAMTAGVTLALAHPREPPAPEPPTITPAPTLHPAAARALRRGFDEEWSWAHKHLTEFRKDWGLDDGPDNIDSDLDDLTRDLATLSHSDWARSSSCWSLYNTFAQSFYNSAPKETNSALNSWLASSILHVGVGIDDVDGLLTATELLHSSLTSACDPRVTATVTPPASINSAWSTWKARSSSWVKKAAPTAHNIASRCPGAVSAQIELAVATDAASCSSAVLALVNEVNGIGSTPTSSSGDPSQTSGAGGDDGEGRDDGNGTDDGNENGENDANGGGRGGGGGSTGTRAAGSEPTTSLPNAGVPKETGVASFAAAAAVAVAGIVAAL